MVVDCWANIGCRITSNVALESLSLFVQQYNYYLNFCYMKNGVMDRGALGL